MALFAILAGGIGFVLRRQEVASVFDPHSGLAERGAPISVALMVFSLGVVLFFFGLSFATSRGRTPALTDTFGSGLLGTLLLMALGLIVLGLAVMEAVPLIQNGPSPPRNIGLSTRSDNLFPLSLVRLGAASFSGLALIFMAILGPRGVNVAIPSTVPVFWICIWLIVGHIDRASNPVLLSYVYNLFALAALLLALYYIAGFAFRQNRPGRLLFSCSTALYFTGVTMGDDLALYTRGTFLALAATVLIYQIALTSTLDRAQKEWEEVPYMERDIDAWHGENFDE